MIRREQPPPRPRRRGASPRPAGGGARLLAVAAAAAAVAGWGCQSLLGIHDTVEADGGVPPLPVSGGVIASVGGPCLAVVPGPAPGTGAGVALAPCDGDDPLQKWRRDSSGRMVAPAVTNGFLTVFNVADAPVAAALPVGVSRDIGSTTAAVQIWTFAGVRIVGGSGLCLDVPFGDFAAEQQAQLYTCEVAPNQQWDISPEGEIRHGSTCLDVPYGFLADGTDVGFFRCGGGPNQQFVFQLGGEVGFGGKCLEAVAAAPYKALLEIQPCAAGRGGVSTGQLFHVEGPMRAAGGCLDASNGGGTPGRPLQVAPCTDAADQTWTWRF